MKPLFPLAPRYRLDDEMLWLEGIDPSRHYWIAVNSSTLVDCLPGLLVSSMDEFRTAILQFRSLQPGEHMRIDRISDSCILHCISKNCYAIETQLNGAPVWHLFDQETLESLLMTSHPDWQCSPKDVELGRRLLQRAMQHTAVA